MKKQILAVAVAGAFAIPAFAAADSSVTLFGQLQTQIVHHSASGDDGQFDSGFRQHDAGQAGSPTDGQGPNRIGVMVNHDLGNGMTALAKFENDFTTGAGGGDNVGFNGPQRDIYVGLRGDFGQIIAGRMTSSYNTAGKDPLNGTFMQARVQGGRQGGLGGFGNGGYVDRGVRYSNSFGIVSMDVGMFLDNSQDGRAAWSGRLNFDLDPVEVYVAHVDARRYENSDADTWRTTKIGADWSAGPFRLNAEIEDFKRDAGIAGPEAEGNTYWAAGTYSMGRNDFVLSLGHTRLDDANNSDFAALAIKHSFSNRVMAYAGVAYNSTDDAGGNFDDTTSTYDGSSDLRFTGVGAGMRVSF
ncbi:porin [Thioalkalivibrio sp. ALJ1]|uniref:porin n=1 Tax=Thioalkalivibrio sp. ALJ1 TaxID=1158144 RepID=UPI000572026B|nr:porin [Thioalkalivibrio sp. ALJ1]